MSETYRLNNADRPPKKRTTAVQGVVLALIFVILAILGLPFFRLFVAYRCSSDISPYHASLSQMKVVEQAIEAYGINNGAPPPTLEALLQPDPANDAFPYLKSPRHIQDAWGRTFGYDPADKDGPVLWFRLSNGRVISNRPPPDDPTR